jgi:DNA-binding NarL/FixJ family response regulator
MVDPGIKHLELQDLSEVRSGTERREGQEPPEDRWRAQLQQTQHLERLGQLASGIAQDFNNLLDVILSYASFVSAELAAPSGPDSPARLESVRRDLEQITLAAERAANVTCQPQAFVHADGLRPGLHPQAPDLDRVVTDVQEMLRRILAEHADLVTTLAGDLWPALADPAQQALLGAIMAGAADYVAKQTSEADLVGAVRTVASEPPILDPSAPRPVVERLQDPMASDDPLAALTAQEKRVLELIGQGLTNRQIAQHMFLAEKTAKNYVSSLLAKLGMHRRTEAAAFAVRHASDHDGLALSRGHVRPGARRCPARRRLRHWTPVLYSHGDPAGESKGPGRRAMKADWPWAEGPRSKGPGTRAGKIGPFGSRSVTS